MAKKTQAKHPKSNHPIVGRLDHEWTNVIPGGDQMGGKVQQGAKECTLCGYDEAFHDLAESDYTGTPEARSQFEEHGGPSEATPDDEKV